MPTSYVLSGRHRGDSNVDYSVLKETDTSDNQSRSRTQGIPENPFYQMMGVREPLPEISNWTTDFNPSTMNSVPPPQPPPMVSPPVPAPPPPPPQLPLPQLPLPPPVEDNTQKIEKEVKLLRLKLFAYHTRLPQLKTIVDWPKDIKDIFSWDHQQLLDLYEVIKTAAVVLGQSRGPQLHNTLLQLTETFGCQAGLKLTGLAEEKRLPVKAQNETERLSQLVTQIEIEYGLGFSNPLVEYGFIIFSAATQRHFLLQQKDQSLLFEKQQFDPVDSDFCEEYKNI